MEISDEYSGIVIATPKSYLQKMSLCCSRESHAASDLIGNFYTKRKGQGKMKSGKFSLDKQTMNQKIL